MLYLRLYGKPSFLAFIPVRCCCLKTLQCIYSEPMTHTRMCWSVCFLMPPFNDP